MEPPAAHPDEVPGAPTAEPRACRSSFPQSSSERVGSRKGRLGDPYSVVVVVVEVVVVVVLVEVVVLVVVEVVVVVVVVGVVVPGFLSDGTHNSRR